MRFHRSWSLALVGVALAAAACSSASSGVPVSVNDAGTLTDSASHDSATLDDSGFDAETHDDSGAKRDAAATCADLEDSCQSEAQCCAGLSCTSGKCCEMYNYECTTDAQCCDGLQCASGACYRPRGASGCDDSLPDCAPIDALNMLGQGQCNGGVCCQSSGEICAADTDCCAGLQCAGNYCE
jgi:hypothetical protein